MSVGKDSEAQCPSTPTTTRIPQQLVLFIKYLCCLNVSECVLNKYVYVFWSHLRVWRDAHDVWLGRNTPHTSHITHECSQYANAVPDTIESHCRTLASFSLFTQRWVFTRSHMFRTGLYQDWLSGSRSRKSCKKKLIKCRSKYRIIALRGKHIWLNCANSCTISKTLSIKKRANNV